MQHHASLVRAADPTLYIASLTEPVVTLFYEKLGIDEARGLTAQAQLRPLAGDTQHFVVTTSFVTHEAQNALLKLFEEPPEGAMFTLVVPTGFAMLPTLQSRIGIESTWQEASDDTAQWQAFAAASYVDRLEQIATWQKNKDKDPVWLQSMVRGVQALKLSQVAPSSATALQLVGTKLATRGAGNKMLLEHLALLLPLQK